jgi:hypothetical protein
MKNATNFEYLLIEKYGEKGTAERDKFDADSLAFRRNAMLKESTKSVISEKENRYRQNDEENTF